MIWISIGDNDTDHHSHLKLRHTIAFQSFRLRFFYPPKELNILIQIVMKSAKIKRSNSFIVHLFIIHNNNNQKHFYCLMNPAFFISFHFAKCLLINYIFFLIVSCPMYSWIYHNQFGLPWLPRVILLILTKVLQIENDVNMNAWMILNQNH